MDEAAVPACEPWRRCRQGSPSIETPFRPRYNMGSFGSADGERQEHGDERAPSPQICVSGRGSPTASHCECANGVFKDVSTYRPRLAAVAGET